MTRYSTKAAWLVFALAQTLAACGGETIWVYPDAEPRPRRSAPDDLLDAGSLPDGATDAGGTPIDGGVSDVGFLELDGGGYPDATPGIDALPRPDATPGMDVGRPPASGAPYANAEEGVHHLAEVLDVSGHYGVALAGGHLVASNATGGSGFPRETRLSSSGTVDIPAGATVRYAFLWYSGPIFMKPAPNGQGDYTADLGGALDNAADVAGNGITFTINGADHGPFDPTTRLPPSPSTVGSQSQLSPHTLDFTFGTFTGVRETVWSNRLDVTGLVAGQSGSVAVTVNPPEKLDVNGNNASSNGGNPAGNTLYNSCSGAASWALMVIYEDPSLPQKNLVLMDGPWARAWDYIFFHTGVWQRPKIRIDHAPIKPGAKFYTYVGSGQPVGSALPASPTCSCGCGGQYTLKNSGGFGLGQNAYFSNTHVDPPQTLGDPIHRDKNNGPWNLFFGGLNSSITGNDWTLFQSADVYTEFPNLYEGEAAPTADSTMPVTHEDDTDASHDTYAGHPWNGRGSVTYHAHGNAISIVEVALDNSAIVPGETTSYVYIKGDQKDVWKPQHIVSMKWLLFETPL